ncbi:MAG: hypothetical protein AB8H12_08110 [Lewinella sp.]
MIRALKIGLPLLLIIGGLLAFKFLTPKGPIDILAAPTEITINAGTLYAAFEADEAAANSKYVGKVIEVSGMLSEMSKNEAGQYSLNLGADSMLGQVVCNLSNTNPAQTKAASIGQSITVKGLCTGYLFDVVLDNSAIISK